MKLKEILVNAGINTAAIGIGYVAISGIESVITHNSLVQMLSEPITGSKIAAGVGYLMGITPLMLSYSLNKIDPVLDFIDENFSSLYDKGDAFMSPRIEYAIEHNYISWNLFDKIAAFKENSLEKPAIISLVSYVSVGMVEGFVCVPLLFLESAIRYRRQEKDIAQEYRQIN